MTMNTDQELMRYLEAEEMAFAKPDVKRMSSAIRQYNPKTKQNDVLVKLASGGAFNIGSEDLPKPEVMDAAPEKPFDMKVQDVKDYSAQLKEQQGLVSSEDLEAAGFDPQVIEMAEPKTLSTDAISQALSDGTPMFDERDPNIRENGFFGTLDFLKDVGFDETSANFIADAMWGYKNPVGTGVMDFATLGIMDIQEGAQLYKDGKTTGSNVSKGLGIVLIAAGIAEATGVGVVVSKKIKANLPAIQKALQKVGTRLNQPGEMPTTSSFGVGALPSGQVPQKLIVDPVLEAAGKEMAASVENVTLGAPTDIPLVSQLAPEYRVTLQGVEPGGTGKQSFIKKDMTPSNFIQMSSNLTQLGEEFTNPLASEETYALMMGKIQNSVEVPKPPSWMIEHSNNIEKWGSWFQGLTPDQLKAADEGLSIQKDFQDAYASGAGPELTGQLMLWSILSRRLSAFPHESGYIELAEAATPFIQKAANGTWTDADTAEWLKVVPQAIPAGTPGKSGTSNANDFGKVFLKKMAAVDENGVSALTRLHNLIANPDMSSTEIRRAYYGLAQDTGIANKILSFALLVSGRNDVVVLDRIQINRMWAGGDKIYDDVYTQFEGAQGLAQYEALERSLAQTVPQMYQAAGRGDVGSVGRYHWESWVLSSGQVVSHPTLEGVVKAGAPKDGAKISPTASVPVREGRFHTKFSGVQYEKLPNGGNRFIYNTSDGQPFQFTKEQLDDMFKEVFSKKSGVLPNDFPGVKAFEGGSIPWFEFKGVDRGKLDEFIRNTGKPITE